MTLKFSLVLSTINRTEQLSRFLEHLDKQIYRAFELIIVDQNDDDRLTPLVNLYQAKLTIIHLHSEPGLSRGRNAGIQKITGDIIAFPDDDCWYHEALLQKVESLFNLQPEIDIITGRTVNAAGKNSLGKFDRHSGEITTRNIFKRGNTNTLFFRREVVDKIAFDESLGLGAESPWGSGEETDYLLQARQMGFRLYYYHNLTVFHDDPIIKYDEKAIQRGYSYGCGMGRVWKKHHYPLDFVWFKLTEQGAGMFIALLQGNRPRFRYHQAVLKGRLKGWRSSLNEELQ